MSVRIWIVFLILSLPFVGIQVVPTSPAVADQAADALLQLRSALGGDQVEHVKSLSAEGAFRRQMGPREIEGTTALTLVFPDRLHRSEETEMPGGASMERVTVLAGDTSWEDVQNRGGMGGGMMMMRAGPGGREIDPALLEQARTRRMKSELQRWTLALLPTSASALTPVGVAEAPEGKADVYEVKDERGQPLRLFIDQQTHLPLMLSFQDIRPRMMFGPGGPGGPGGQGGSGRRGRPGGDVPPAPGPPQAGRPGTEGQPSLPPQGERPTPEQMRQRLEAQGPPKPSAVTLYLADHRPVDGVMLPHRISQSVDGQPVEEWTVEKYLVNPKLKADLFDKKSK